MRVAGLLACLILCLPLSCLAANQTNSKGKTTAASTKAKPSSTKGKAPSQKKANTKAPAQAKTACKPVKGKAGKCAVPASTPKALNSPIASDALERDTNKGMPELKARSVPDRAYAIDGESFFHQGRRIRIEGLLPSASNGELAKQRLQMLLDSGNVSIEQISIDDTGVANAQVRINGRDAAGQLNGH